MKSYECQTSCARLCECVEVIFACHNWPQAAYSIVKVDRQFSSTNIAIWRYAKICRYGGSWYWRYISAHV